VVSVTDPCDRILGFLDNVKSVNRNFPSETEEIHRTRIWDRKQFCQDSKHIPAEYNFGALVL
jgi:hypothetical protein